jgi:transcriptional regulator with XRE-family HTH domain
MTEERFKAIRLYLGMSQQQFADHFGLSLAVVGMIETKQRRVTANTEAKIARKFKASEEFLEFLENRKKLAR